MSEKIDRLEGIQRIVNALGEPETKARLEDLIHDENFSAFELGALLVRIQEQAWFEGKTDEEFARWVQIHVKMEWPTAHRFIRHFLTVKEAGLNEKDLEGISMSAVEVLRPILSQKELSAGAGRATVERFLRLARVKPIPILRAEVRRHFGRRVATKDARERVRDTNPRNLEAALQLIRETIEDTLGEINLHPIDKCVKVVEVLSNLYPDLEMWFKIGSRDGNHAEIGTSDRALEILASLERTQEFVVPDPARTVPLLTAEVA